MRVALPTSNMKPITFARQLRRQQTDAENMLWSRLRAHRLFGLKFRRQQPMGSYVVDFFCPEKMLIVELDGGQHQDRAGYDQARDDWLKSEGYTVLRYWNNELMCNLDGVLEDICRCAGVLEKASPSDETTSQPTRLPKCVSQVSGCPQPLSPQGRWAQTLEMSSFSPPPIVGGEVTP